MCVECEDTEAAVKCDNCQDEFCELCYLWLHNKGKRKAHVRIDLPHAKKRHQAAYEQKPAIQQPGSVPPTIVDNTTTRISANAVNENKMDDKDLKIDADMLKLRDAVLSDLEVQPLLERVKYIPLRLNERERQLLNILEGALEVSEYTDNVDVSDSDYGRGGFWGFSLWSQPYSKHERGGPSRSELILRELQEVFDLLVGLFQCSDYRMGSHLLKSNDDDAKVEFIQTVFEVGRRHKVMNPEKMRATYGKMMYILQDAVKPGRLPFSCVVPIKTVYSLLEEKSALGLLSDEEAVQLFLAATREIAPDPQKSKEDIKVESDQKSNALKQLIAKYTSEELTEEDIVRCVNSIADNTTFITLERWPVDRMLYNLTTYFSPNKASSPSLAISYGREGSKLSHDHHTQFTFVLQSLLLWREIINNMFRLWFMTEQDLLGASSYMLRDTGQGLNRVQECPSVSRQMHGILGRVQQKARGWVGLSVVHLGDRDVPNALVFIDKYTQVARILGPIVLCVDRLEELTKDPNLARYFNKCGGVNAIRVAILQDYFRHGFDGSGSDGGSCIDGRLTSSWNWCAKVEKKPFFPVFLLSGFKGFDGSFR
jgi:hypothetical protein